MNPEINQIGTREQIQPNHFLFLIDVYLQEENH